MEKMRMASMDLTAQNIEKLETLFPNCITETVSENGRQKKAVNFDLLRQMLSDEIQEGEEAYEFTWVGKKAAIVEANQPIRKTLRPCPEQSEDWETTENLYIEGDNLEVLKLLQESYLGRIQMIYIDPPYNTGSDSFVYPDNYKIEQGEYQEAIGLYDEYGNKRFYENNIANPRFHSDWLSMMYARLLVARNLLACDGAIFVHIDEGELFNLEKILDEVFGASCFVNIISVKTKLAGVSGSYMGKSLQNNTEYILFYCKDPAQFQIHHLPKKRQELMDFIQSYADEGKSFKYTSVLKKVDEGRFVKTIPAGNGDEMKVYVHEAYEIVSIQKLADQEFEGDLKKAYYHYIDSIFRTTNAQTSIRARIMEETKELAADLISIVYVPAKGKYAGQFTRVYYKDAVRNMITMLKEVVAVEEDGIYKLDNAGNLWDDINYNNLANEAGLSFPNGQKPVQLLQRLIQLFDWKEGLFLDFFSGSATTAHAVMKCNLEDGGKRKFMMVQLSEPCAKNSVLYKAGYQNICEIGKERIRRASKRIKEAGAPAKQLDMGFRVFQLDSANMNDVYYAADAYSQDLLFQMESNIKADRTDLDLLFGCLLEWGLPLSVPYQSLPIGNCTIHICQNGELIACFDENIPEAVLKEVAKRRPRRAVFRDSGFINSTAKINAGELFKMLAPETRIKVL